jgi:hypothetical protein
VSGVVRARYGPPVTGGARHLHGTGSNDDDNSNNER